MKIIELKSNEIEQNFLDFKAGFGGSLKKLPAECQLELDNELAKGYYTGVDINKKIRFLEYDISFGQDTCILNSGTPNAVYFMYCARGQMSHGFGIRGNKAPLNKFQTGIFASAPDVHSSFFFRKDHRTRVLIITVNTASSGAGRETEALLQRQLMRRFIPGDGQEVFTYTSSYNLKIAEQIQRLDAIKKDGVIRNLLIKSIVHKLLASEIQQHNKDLKEVKNNWGSLTRKEMERVRELSAFIKNYPEVAYSLDYLSGKSGLSPAKLQEGFKRMHARTVADHIRNVRLERAEQLIRTTDLNISEVVYTVGLTSRSYFSKIFKEKYGCSPKYYKDHQKEEVQMAL
jgi:AraC-like DNA-binding protein